jgi:hypothetical protein
MITANPDVNIAQFVTAFNQLVDIHIVNILAIAERENYPINLTDFTMEDKDDVFDEEWDLAYAPSSNPDSDSNEAQLVSIAIQEQNQINYAAQIQAIALSMFDGLDKLGKDKTENKRDGTEQETSQTSTDKATNDERDLKLARDCRELLQVQGKEDVMDKSNLVSRYTQHQQSIADITVAIPLIFLGCIAIAKDGLSSFADRRDCPDLPDIPRTG